MDDADVPLYDMDSADAGLKSGVYTRFAGCHGTNGSCVGSGKLDARSGVHAKWKLAKRSKFSKRRSAACIEMPARRWACGSAAPCPMTLEIGSVNISWRN